MSEVSLKEYRARARELLDTGAHDQAIAICQHILHYYPKDVMTYQLLGEICLDKRDYSQAIDFFQRVLSADPENFIARVGLSICFDEGGSVEEAIWQLERAFELNPGSVEVRSELRRLYSQRDGAEVAKIKLNAGALGRLYAKGEFFQLAVTEFRGLLAQDPQLVDVQVALAETLWRYGRRTEAAQLCVEILKQLPNCLKANLILADIWRQGERPEEGEAKLELVRDLDPAGTLAQEVLGERSFLPPAEAMLPALDGAALAAAARKPPPGAVPTEKVPEEGAEETEQPRRLEVQPQEAIPAAEEEAEMPDWLRSLRAGTVEEPAAVAPEPEEEAGGEKEGIPTWLRELQQEQPLAEEAPTVEEVEVEGEKAAVLAGETEESVKIPEWLSGLGEEMVEAEEPEEQVPAVAEPAEEIPEWLRQLKPQEAEEGAQEVGEEEIPVWLRGLREELPAEEEVEGEAAEVPAWLHELAGAPSEEIPLQAEEPAQAISAEEPLPEEPAAEPAEEIPEWLLALKPEGVEEAAPTEVPSLEPVSGVEEISEEMPEARPGGEEAGEGLMVEQLPAEMTFEQLVAEVAPELAGQVPEWLEGTEVEEAKAEPEEELAVAEAAPPTPGEEVAEWPREAEPEVAEAAAQAPAAEEGELPEWLRGLEAEVEEGKKEEEVFAAEVPTPKAEEELPEWLRELEPEAAEELAPPEALPVGMGEKEAPLETPIAEAEIAGEVSEEVGEEEEEAPEWLRSLRSEFAEKLPAAEPAEEIPEWLRELEPALPEERVEAAEVPGAEAPPEVVEEAELPEEMPDWLHELRETTVEVEEGARVEAEVPPAVEAGEEIPQWLRELKPVIPGEELVGEAVTMPPGEIEGIPEWLRRAETPEEVPPSVPPPMEEAVEEEEEKEERMPAWLRDLEAVEEVRPLETEEVAPAGVGPEFEEEEAPEWLRELEAEVEKLPPELFAPAAKRVGEEEITAEEAPALAEFPAEVEKIAAEAELLEEFPPELLATEEAEEKAVVEEPAAAAPPSPQEAELLAEFPPELFAPPPSVEEVIGEEQAEEAAVEAVPAPVEEAEEPAIREAKARVAAQPGDHHGRLALARAYRDAERWNDALAQYEKLIKAGELVDAVIEDMEQVVEQRVADHATYILLGDAYVKDGRLQKALAAYKEAMARL